MIKDSGNRTTFESGAVRDIQENKGRCDLMPLAVVATLLENLTGGDYIVGEIGKFAQTGKTAHLYKALIDFSIIAFNDSVESMLLETSIHFSEGAKKYGENNWQKGIPSSSYINSALRHYLKWRRGDKDEMHHRAFVWNIMCCIWEVDYHAEN